MLKHIPNTLTIIRIICAGLFPLLYKEYALIIIIIALVTEYFDGALARWFKIGSKLGALLDPIADKLFVFSVVAVMFYSSDIPIYFFFLLGARDIIVFGGSLMVAIEGNWHAFWDVKPRIAGKVATTFQFAVLIAFYYQGHVQKELLVVTSIVSLFAGLDYLWLFYKSNFYRRRKSL